MKHILLLTALSLLFSFSRAQEKTAAAYSDIVTAKKITVKCKKYPDKTAVYMIPIVSKKYPELKKALCDTSVFFGDKLDSVIKEFQTEGRGITSFSYDITFLDKDVISLKLHYETIAAYPDESQTWLTLNVHTGKLYPISDELNSNGLKWMFNNYKSLLWKRILQDKKENQGEGSDDYDLLKSAVDSLHSDDLFKGFIFTKEGMMVSMEKILPHVVQVYEPDREWLVPYGKLKPYILPSAVVLKKWKRKTY
jgi:hypothetical protein